MKNLMHQETYDSLLSSLLAYENAGVRITNAGNPSSPREIARACSLRNSCEYILDYIPDDCGKISEIRFEDIYLPNKTRPFRKKHYKII